MAFLFMLLSGFLARADGWGTDDAKWVKVSEFFNVWTCSALFGLLSFLFGAPLLLSVALAAAFLVWRLPGFHGWESWKEMYWRGLWTSAIGFSLVSLAAHNSVAYGFLSIPFSAVYALSYVGSYKWLPETLLWFNRHVWAEHSSGWFFGAFSLIISTASN